MAGLMDLLAAGLSSASQPPITNTPTPVEGVDAIAPRPQVGTPGAGTAYDNTPEVQAVRGVQGQYPQHEGMFHTQGTLRNLLGTLGDAFLVQSGHQPVYAPQVQREKIADAMVGFQNNPAIAASRIAATAAPDSPEIANKVFEEGQTGELKKLQMQYLEDNRNSQNDIKNEAVIARRTPQWGQVLAAAKDKDSYARAYDLVNSSLGQLNSKNTTYDPSTTLSAVKPEDWTPGSMDTFGASTGQVLRNDLGHDNLDQRKAWDAAHPQQPRQDSAAAYAQNLAARVNNGETLGAGDQAIFDNYTGKNRGKTKLPIPGLSVSPPSGGGSSPGGRLTPAQAAKLPSGASFIGTDGVRYTKH